MTALALTLSLHWPGIDWTNPATDPRLVATALDLLDRKE